MTAWLILAAVAVPPLGLAALLGTPLRTVVVRLVPVAPLPALAVALAGSEAVGGTVAPLVSGLRLGLDESAGVLLVQVSVMWMLAGLHLLGGEPFRRRFPLVCLLMTMAGSLGAMVALDRLSFYVFLSVMTVASYGLVETGQGDRRQRRAARVYLSLALAGEFLALAAFLLAATGGAEGPAYVWLLYFGIGAKLGVLPLHVALPLVYRAAPPVGAAVMGGVLLSGTAVGWLRFMPEGGSALAEAAPVFLTIGLATAVLGVLAGLFQRDARAALGYSTVSQMGLFTAFMAVAAAEPGTWAAVVPVLVVFLVHHGFSKGGLLLALDSSGGAAGMARRLVVVVLSLALAAAPATGGAISKLWMEGQLTRLPDPWPHLVEQVLPWSSVATALLMARITWLAVRGGAKRQEDGRPGAVPALVTAAAALALPWWIVTTRHEDPQHLVLSAAHLWSTAWPAGLGVGLFLGAALAARTAGRWPVMPPGDVLTPAGRTWRALNPVARFAAMTDALGAAGRLVRQRTRRLTVALFGRLRYAERDLRDLRVTGAVFAGLVVGLTVLALLAP